MFKKDDVEFDWFRDPSYDDCVNIWAVEVWKNGRWLGNAHSRYGVPLHATPDTDLIARKVMKEIMDNIRGEKING